MTEEKKADHKKDSEKIKMLLGWKKDEERLVNMAINKDTSFAPTDDLN